MIVRAQYSPRFIPEGSIYLLTADFKKPRNPNNGNGKTAQLYAWKDELSNQGFPFVIAAAPIDESNRLETVYFMPPAMSNPDAWHYVSERTLMSAATHLSGFSGMAAKPLITAFGSLRLDNYLASTV